MLDIIRTQMKKLYYFLGLIAIVLMMPAFASAANNGELVQAAGNSKVYFIEGNLKRHVADYATFQNWNFNVGQIRRISAAELNNHPTGPALTRVIHYAGNVYLVENGTRRYVPTAQSLTIYGYSFAQLVDLNTDTFDRLSEGSTLTAPKAVRVPGDSRVFYLDGGVRRPFASDYIMTDGYGITREGAPVSAAAASLPIGSTLTNVIHYNGNLYYMGGGGRRYHIGTEPTLLYNNLRWEDVRDVGSDIGNLPEGDSPLRPPAFIRTTGSDRIWMVDDNGERRWVPSTDMLNEWGYTEANVVTVSNAVAYKWPEVSQLTRYVGRDGLGYYIEDGKRYVIYDRATAEMFGLSDSDHIYIGWIGLTHAVYGGDLQLGVQSLEGYNIPSTSGKTAREQHLYLSKTESDLGRTDASALVHYSASGTPGHSQNGMAGGYGSFGSEASPASSEQERYYVTMRWNYCDWYEDPGTLDSFGRSTTRCGNYNSTAKSWHRHKKVIVTNPSNGRQMVLSVEEAGPAIWTDRVSGLSPEAMSEIGAVTNSNLTYYWAANQNMRLGRIR